MKASYPLCLGTAMWAWTVDQAHAFALLDQWYAAGWRGIDTATNYPINKDPQDFRKAEQWLAQWIQMNGVQDLQIMVKVGAMDNSGSPENNLSPSFLSIAHQHYTDLFEHQLDCVMIHWDNREDPMAIQDSVSCLLECCSSEQQVGFSGIKHPAAYQAILENMPYKPVLQVKHNPFQSHVDYYKDLWPFTRLLAYGLSGGGIKLSAQQNESTGAQARGVQLEPHQERIQFLQAQIQKHNNKFSDASIQHLHHLGMIHAFLNEHISGLLIGPSNVDQLTSTLVAYELLKAQEDIFSNLFKAIQ